MSVTVDTSDLHRLTLEEYHQLIESGGFDEGTRVELIHGLLLDMSPRSKAHEQVVIFLNIRLAKALDGARFELRPGCALTLGDSEPEPDLAVVEKDVERPYHPSTATVVIEVSVSSQPRDLKIKPSIYAAAGIPEYWVIDVERRRAIVHRDPTRAGYGSVTVLGAEDALDGSSVGIGEIPLAELFAAAAGDVLR